MQEGAGMNIEDDDLTMTTPVEIEMLSDTVSNPVITQSSLP